MKCIVCKKPLKNVADSDNQPCDGVAFQSSGNYGSAVFDPMDGTFLEVNVCDECLKAAGADGNVLIGFPQPSRRGPMMQWPLTKIESLADIAEQRRKA